MEGMEGILNEAFEAGFGENYDIATKVVCVIECALSLTTIGVGGALATI